MALIHSARDSDLGYQDRNIGEKSSPISIFLHDISTGYRIFPILIQLSLISLIMDQSDSAHAPIDSLLLFINLSLKMVQHS